MKSPLALYIAFAIFALGCLSVYVVIASGNFDIKATKALFATPKAVSHQVVLKQPTPMPKAVATTSKTTTQAPTTTPTPNAPKPTQFIPPRLYVPYTAPIYTPYPTVKLLPTIPPYQPLPTRPPTNVYWHPNPPAPTVPYGFSN